MVDLAQIDKFCKRTEKYGYTNKRITIGDIIRNRDRQIWEKITTKNHCLNDLLRSQRTRQLRERFKQTFINRCLFKFL